jgi:hypothetical protein
MYYIFFSLLASLFARACLVFLHLSAHCSKVERFCLTRSQPALPYRLNVRR